MGGQCVTISIHYKGELCVQILYEALKTCDRSYFHAPSANKHCNFLVAKTRCVVVLNQQEAFAILSLPEVTRHSNHRAYRVYSLVCIRKTKSPKLFFTHGINLSGLKRFVDVV